MWLNVILLLTVSLAAARCSRRWPTACWCSACIGLAFIGGWIEQFGAFLDNPTAINIGILSSLIIPSEALWKRAVYEMQSPLLAALGSFTPFSSTSTPSPLMIAYAIVYLLVALGLAVRWFGRRDL